MARVALTSVTKEYSKGRAAVSNLSLEVRDGEFLVLVGPSGCGKSTALRMIAGLEEATAGEIWIGERLVNDLSPRERDIAMVFQSYALYPHMTAFDNIAYSLKVRRAGRDEIERRVRQTAGILGIEALLEKRPRELSGGERQRVALGRAIVRDPQVFLFDEPLSNLDAKLRVQMRAEITALHRRLGITTIYVTHDQVEAMTMGERIAVLRDGALQQIATPLDLYDRPANRFVAGFIGAPPMNFFEAAQQEGDRYRLVSGDEIALPGASSRPRVTLGVRPEDFLVADSQTRGIRATAQIVERTGAESYLYAKCGDDAVVVRLAGSDAPVAGAPVTLAPNLAKAHLFDGATGERIGYALA
ncbi:MAG: ABC transporter ATP-binding protein [bacterium]